MATYQYKREPLTNANADRLANACRSGIEKVVISTLLDTGLRVSELAGLTKESILWQDRRLLVYGKGGTGKTTLSVLPAHAWRKPGGESRSSTAIPREPPQNGYKSAKARK